MKLQIINKKSWVKNQKFRCRTELFSFEAKLEPESNINGSVLKNVKKKIYIYTVIKKKIGHHVRKRFEFERKFGSTSRTKNS